MVALSVFSTFSGSIGRLVLWWLRPRPTPHKIFGLPPPRSPSMIHRAGGGTWPHYRHSLLNGFGSKSFTGRNISVSKRDYVLFLLQSRRRCTILACRYVAAFPDTSGLMETSGARVNYLRRYGESHTRAFQIYATVMWSPCSLQKGD